MDLILKKIISSSLVAFLTFSLFVPQVGAEKRQQTAQPVIDARAKKTLTVEGKTFKDLNGNGQLDPYENWQLSDDERARDLISKMTLEEKAGLLVIPEFPKFQEGKLVLPNKMINQTTRYFIFREFPSADVIAGYNNQIQEAAEATRLGIPAVIISNPRNHPANVPNLETAGQFSYWPDPLGLAATRDLNLISEFARISGREFRASGIRKLYGYSADVSTDPEWPRIDETFGEDPRIISDIIFRIVKGYQGDILNENSVSTTVRHFPGGGAREEGKDPHFEEGQYNIYPTKGSLVRYHIPPFRAAIEADATSIMPYYAYPSNKSAEQGLPHFSPQQQFEEVGFALNRSFITDYLRGQLGFLGYVNSDTSAVVERAWGALDLPIEQRFAKALNAGTNIFSGVANPTPIITAVNQGLVSVDRVNRSATYLVTEMMKLGLFENPYVDPKNALNVANDPTSQERADLAHRKSVVLMRNDNNLLPLTDEKIRGIRLYVEMFPGGTNGAATQRLRETIQNYDKSITLTDNLENATHALIWIMPKQDILKRFPQLLIGPETEVSQIDRINQIQKRVPTITAINLRSPWMLNNVEPNATSFIGTFGTKPEALIDVIRGRFNPVGKLPFTMPANQQAVDNEVGDIPGFREDPSYVYRAKSGDAYIYNFGLSYNTARNERKGFFDKMKDFFGQ
ncbi:glycoside hydrolase family 3 N-terminal domain-containing protein [Neobacillus sp. YIM B06451]|uniref:glycoside hydrolase family 3 protein n=1 Tax=Neobacillus sp. YIM B06451 TaxID=3070994 RepID=UPI00292CCB1C|nr:glycoside hydrolase family 3 N-terminal domain-containing protein [Neobacillus sp. YIM B06451]